MLIPGSGFLAKIADTIEESDDTFDQAAEHDRMAKEYDDKITDVARHIVELRAIADADISTMFPANPAPPVPNLEHSRSAEVAKIYQRIRAAQEQSQMSSDAFGRLQIDMRLLEIWLNPETSHALVFALAPQAPQPDLEAERRELRAQQDLARQKLNEYNLRRHEPEIAIAFGRADAMLVMGVRG